MDYKKTLIYKDINEIPELIEKFKLNNKLKKFLKTEEVFLLGRGSSGNATIFAKYIWEIYCGIIVNFIHPHSIFNAEKKLNFKNRLVFSFSQSGRSNDIVECSRILKKWGGALISITNEPDLSANNLAKISDLHILLSDSKEIAVAATKSFTMQLYSILAIAGYWNAKFSKKSISSISNDIKRTINIFDKFYEENNLYDLIKKSGMIGFVGRGPLNSIAEDSALKFREMASKHSMGYSAAEFLHGPIGSYGKNDLVFILSKDKRLSSDLLKVIDKLKERNTKFKMIYPLYGYYPINSLALDVLIKLIALKYACQSGLNPDSPKGLSKVTQTK